MTSRVIFIGTSGLLSSKLPVKERSAFWTHEQGAIKAWGLGTNRVEPCELAVDMTDVRPNVLLVAGRYTLLDHERALQRLMPACEAKEIDVVIGGPYS